MPKKWPSLRRRPLVAGLVVAALVVLITLGAVRYTRLYGDLTDGKDLLLAAAAVMEDRGLNIESAELDDVEVSFQQAQDKLESAADPLESDPLLFVARHLPWLGSQVEAGRDLVEIGADGSDIGLEAARAMRSYHNVRDSEGGALSEKVTLVLDAVEPHVEVIDAQSNAVVATLPIGQNPLAIAVNPSTNRIYVVTYGSREISVIDGESNTVIARVSVGELPIAATLSPETNRIYVADGAAGYVAVIDGSTNRLIASANLDGIPSSLAVNPVTERVYVARSLTADVTVIDGATNAIIATVALADALE